MFDLLLESSHRDDSNKWSNIGFGQEIMELVYIEVYFKHIIWSSDQSATTGIIFDFIFEDHQVYLCLVDIAILIVT